MVKNDFLTYQAQTSSYPLSIEIKKAKGSYIYDNNGKKYLDFVAGVSANSLGHQHPKVTRAVKKQLNKYTHVMVYGEFIQEQPLLNSPYTITCDGVWRIHTRTTSSVK